jgi:hypothetical protein
MAANIDGWRRRIDAVAHDLLMNKDFVMDHDDMEEFVRLCRVQDEWREREVEILRREKEVLHAQMVSTINTLKMQHVEMNSRIKTLKDERGVLRGQVHRLEEVLESHDIQYCIEIDGKRDLAIKHDFYVGDHVVVVLNGLQAPVSWYRPGNKNGRFIDSGEALHAQVTGVTVDRVYLLNTYKDKFCRSPKHIKRLRRAATRGKHG